MSLNKILFSVLTILLITYSSYSANCIVQGEIDEILQEVKSNYHEVQLFRKQSEEWDNGIIKEEFDSLTEIYYKLVSIHNELTKEDFYRKYSLFEERYEKFNFAYKILETKRAYEIKNEDTYYKLWNEIAIRDIRVNKLYVETAKVSGNSVLGYNKSQDTIKKRHLFLAYKACYDDFLVQLKSKRRFVDRIIIERDIIKLQKKAINLFDVNTKELEKRLRKSTDTNEKFLLILE